MTSDRSGQVAQPERGQQNKAMNHDPSQASDSEREMAQLLESQRREEFVRLKSRAESLSHASLFMLVVSLLALLCAFVSSGRGVIGNLAFWVVGGFFCITVILFFASQFFHIRAGLEKLGLK
jgi:predicted membrane channel-forming protein YqfA (hemolysin III family)